MIMEYWLVLRWLVLYLLFMAVGLPLSSLLFPRFADRGAGLALPLALAVAWVVIYVVGQVALGIAFWVGLLALVALSLVAASRGASIDRRRYAETAAVFSVAFLFFVAIRAVDAGIHPFAGEKFLDFGLMKATLRADTLPPEDMWFAGEPVQYYYGGHLLAAFLTRISSTTPRFGYNLALSGFYAMLVTAAYGLAGSIAANRGGSRIQAGALGAFFAGIASNLSTPGRFLLWLFPGSLTQAVAGLTPIEIKRLVNGPAAFIYWSASRIIVDIRPGKFNVTTINEFPFFAWLNGDMHAHMMNTPFLLLAAGILGSYYLTPAEERRRRLALLFGVLPPLAGMVAVVSTWSFPTVGGLAFLTLALAPTSPLSLLPSRAGAVLDFDDDLYREGGRYGTALAGTGVILGLAALWSLPFWLGTASGREIAWFPTRSSMGELLTVHGGFVFLFALFLGRHASAHADRENLGEVLLMISVGGLVAWIGLDAPVIAVFGSIIVLGWVLLRTQDVAPRDATASVRERATRPVADGGVTTADGAASVEAISTRLRNVVGYETVLILAGAGLVLIVEFAYVKEQAGPGRMNTVFKTYMDVWVLWAVAAGAVAARMIGNRSMSLPATSPRWRRLWRGVVVSVVLATSLYAALAVTTHFRTLLSVDALGLTLYPYHLWLVALLFAVVFAVYKIGSFLAPIVYRAFPQVDPGPTGRAVIGTVGTFLLVTAVVFVGFSALSYAPGGAMLNQTTHPEDPTLDGLRWVSEDHPAEAQAINWLDSLEGQPNFAAAPGRQMYMWTSAPSSLTGVPTLAGWAHEVGYRGGETYRTRVSHVNAVFTGDRPRPVNLEDPAYAPARNLRGAELQRFFLDHYDVEYVYVGPRERDNYRTGITVTELDAVTEVKRFTADTESGTKTVVIYRVDQDQLDTAAD